MTRVAFALALLTSLGSTWALAHEVDADALIFQGLDLRRAGKPAEALELFRRAHLESPSPRTLGQMGLVETSLARWMDADTHLAASLATPADVWVRKNRPFLEQALDRTKTHLGELVVSGRPGTTVSWAGDTVGALPFAAPLRTAEGNFTLTATAAGFKPVSIPVSIKGGARTAVTIVLEPVDVGAPGPALVETSPVSHPPPFRARRWGGIALAAGGVGVLTWGIAWIALDNHVACGSSRSGPCGTVYDTRTAGWILAASGGALALTGGAILFSTFRAPQAELAWAVTPSSLLLQGRF